VVGCGSAGAITIDALIQEGVFDKITDTREESDQEAAGSQISQE
jgi:hypothetical protein